MYWIAAIDSGLSSVAWVPSALIDAAAELPQRRLGTVKRGQVHTGAPHGHVVLIEAFLVRVQAVHVGRDLQCAARA
jgi:hypothetical protein